jgi:hypothetical protein
MTLTTQFHTFLSDPVLARAVELVRKVDDVFDLINPIENQHSRILQWLFDPREGHGQGEAIFKDFLNAVYEVNLGATSKQLLFKNWNPGRIAITGFQSLIVVREKAILGAGRQDLLIVDPVHKFVILVENKSGSKWAPAQLAGYRKSLLALTKQGQPYQGFKTGFVLLDKFKDEFAEGTQASGGPARDKEILQWCHVNYTWLEKAARRAEVRAMRNGDVGHQLVISYCRRQAEYESDDEKTLDGILASINQAHRDVVQEISSARKQHRPTLAQLKLKDIKSLIWVWAHQNRDLSMMLEHQKPLAFLASGLTGVFGNAIEQDVGKKVMYVIDKSWDTFRDPAAIYWPLTVKIRDTTPTEEGDGTVKRKYSVVVEFWPIRVQEEILAKLKTALRNVFGKEVDKFATANVRRIGRTSGVPEERLQREVEKMVRLLQEGLRGTIDSQ